MLTDLVRKSALEEGFADCAITTPDAIPGAGERLRAFVEAGHHAGMEWMAETLERRSSPSALWPEVRSIIMLSMNYTPDGDPLANLADPTVGNISVYARHRDYHDVVKGKLKAVASKLAARAGAEVKVFVDTAPVMEKPLAAAAGIGWQGKHTNLVSTKRGSWLFLGAIFTTADMVIDQAESDHCGSCRACLDACPTQAFPAPYRLDGRRCISYLTIEHKGMIDVAFRKAIGNRIYGCDDCLAACPWNKFAKAASEIKLQARPDLLAPPLDELLALDDAAFRSLFSGSPVKRIGRDRFLRNCLIAAGNSGDAGLVGHGIRLLGDPSPLVAAAAVWMLSQFLGPDEMKAMVIACPTAGEPVVADEWRQAGVDI
mgnify:CR=1 FL=1